MYFPSFLFGKHYIKKKKSKIGWHWMLSGVRLLSIYQHLHHHYYLYTDILPLLSYTAPSSSNKHHCHILTIKQASPSPLSLLSTHYPPIINKIKPKSKSQPLQTYLYIIVNSQYHIEHGGVSHGHRGVKGIMHQCYRGQILVFNGS